jgi:hypothetical protein
MRKNPRRILSPQRLPFRHPGAGRTNLANTDTYCKKTSKRHPHRICGAIERTDAASCVGRQIDPWRCERAYRAEETEVPAASKTGDISAAAKERKDLTTTGSN